MAECRARSAQRDRVGVFEKVAARLRQKTTGSSAACKGPDCSNFGCGSCQASERIQSAVEFIERPIHAPSNRMAEFQSNVG